MHRDLELLQGSWNLSALEMDGHAMDSATLAQARIVIAGNRFTSSGMGATYEGTLDLQDSIDPAGIDMHFDTGPEKGATNLGVYRIEGESWKLCLATRGNVRPHDFISPPGSGFACETLTRAAAATAVEMPAASNGVPTEFEGEWSMVSGTMDGKPLDEETVKMTKRIITGNRTVVRASGFTILNAQFTCDASASPKTIDYVTLAGANIGKSQAGIYELEGGLLKVCVAAYGKPRPERFESIKGDKRTFSTWRR